MLWLNHLSFECILLVPFMLCTLRCRSTHNTSNCRPLKARASFLYCLDFYLQFQRHTHSPPYSTLPIFNRCKWNSSRCIAQNISEPIFNPFHQVNWFPYPFNIQILFAANKVLRYPSGNKVLRNHHHVTSSKSVYVKITFQNYKQVNHEEPYPKATSPK